MRKAIAAVRGAVAGAASLRWLRRRNEDIAWQSAHPPGRIVDVEGIPIHIVERGSGPNAAVLIHGHTHRPARHVHRVEGIERVRWVLPDWYEGGGYLEASPAGIRAVDAA